MFVVLLFCVTQMSCVTDRWVLEKCTEETLGDPSAPHTVKAGTSVSVVFHVSPRDRVAAEGASAMSSIDVCTPPLPDAKHALHAPFSHQHDD